MNQAFPQHFKLFFHGKGGRYFGIWAVNVILTILTLLLTNTLAAKSGEIERMDPPFWYEGFEKTEFG